MKTLAIALTAFLLSGAAFAENELDRADLPRTLLIKKDQNGNITIFKSTEVLDRVDKSNAQELEKIAFEKLSASDKKNLNLENLGKSDNELDNDSPRQSWYVYWGYAGYVYSYNYYPVYYYSYAYYPYYYYPHNGCSYYWYRW